MDCCSITDLRNKQVINTKTGCQLGFVSDVEIDTCKGNLVALIIWGRSRLSGFGKRDDDIRICWNDIQVIGDDTILVCNCEKVCRQPKNSKSFFENLFR